MQVEESHGIVFLGYNDVGNVEFIFLSLMLNYWETKC